jgi:hypothetical protein
MKLLFNKSGYIISKFIGKIDNYIIDRRNNIIYLYIIHKKKICIKEGFFVGKENLCLILKIKLSKVQFLFFL